ncbi:ABC transporter G family member 23-like, partial [Oppia nitens]|uniref:ABC transporter G family member 23-like n=1 Tax=Oppia nitens TaxID=1686743 RepID=UPI0023DA30B3
SIKTINNFSLNVTKGHILALLGCNGSGKTTLMKLILGRLRPQSGNIFINNDSKQLNGNRLANTGGPGVGYMPQEIALFNDFTVKQMFHYYGLIYQMNSQTVNNRMDELMVMFELPSMDQSVDTMSGGQQRLVSLAITLIHSPKLLLLDEPTVGVDSIIRSSIWHYLEQLCHENNTTVIITTHYTEEARRADSVAFIYNGYCLANQSPNQLIDTYRCSTLDDVYYELWTYIYYYLIPFAMIIPAHLAFDSPHDIPIAIVNNDNNNNSISIQFTNLLNNQIFRKTYYNSTELAYDSVVSGKNQYSIVISDGFSDEIIGQLTNGIIKIDDQFQSNSSTIRLSADMTNIVGVYYGQYYIFSTLTDVIGNYSQSIGHNPRAYSMPIDITYNNNNLYRNV